MAPWLLAFSLSLCVAQAKILCREVCPALEDAKTGACERYIDPAFCEQEAVSACLSRAVRVCKLGTESQRCRRPVTIEPGEGGR